MTRRGAIASNLAMLWFPAVATSAEASGSDCDREAPVHEGPIVEDPIDASGDAPSTLSEPEPRDCVDPASGPITVKLRLLPDRPVSATGYEFEIVATNESEEPVTLEFRNGQVFDLWILGTGGALVWRWASGRMFTQALREIRLLPGESASRQVVWPGTDASGTIQVTGPLVARADWVSRPGGSSRPLSFVAE